MNTKTETIYLYLVTRPNTEPHFHCSTVDMTGEPDWTFVESKPISFDLPEISDLTDDVVAGLEETRGKMRAAANAAITEVDNRIASYLALENFGDPS